MRADASVASSAVGAGELGRDTCSSSSQWLHERHPNDLVCMHDTEGSGGSGPELCPVTRGLAAGGLPQSRPFALVQRYP